MRKIQHDAVVSEWKEIITACRESGLPVSQWCRSNNVRESRYYYWLRVIRSEALALRVASNNSKPVFAELTAPAISSVQSAEPGVCAVIRLNDISVEIFNGANQSTISAIVATLKAQC